ncbi:MAG: NAD+ synthase [Candidatus Magnetoovum sp. WYHC-5]|nr:NAD+ synthase [Candidatus Magnetoovum sp. WYHC-5]
MKKLRLALGQINTTVGHLEGNINKIIEYVKKAEDLRADIIAFPELSITGYPPEDLLLKTHFIKNNMLMIERLKAYSNNIVILSGFVYGEDDIFNACAVMYEGKVLHVYKKIFLPNYGVFDELRYFKAGRELPLYEICGVKVGVNICEDMWYPDGPAHEQALAGAEVIININASPYSMFKGAFRQTMLSVRAFDNSVIIAYVNSVGGQDELVFDGHSLVVDPKGRVIARGKQFTEELIVVDLDIESVFMARLHDPRRRLKKDITKDIKTVFVSNRCIEKPLVNVNTTKDNEPMEHSEEVYNAILMGTKDYILKNRFRSVVIGLSGGIDSAIVAVIAKDAIGSENVKGVFMPSQYTSVESSEDVYALANNLGIDVIEIPIVDIFNSYLIELSTIFKGMQVDTTEENLQARIRGNILMAISNKFGSLVLTTGNKSEMSVGYATLYGDMAGGFAVIKDVPKTLVYKISRWRNTKGIVIPERILIKEPTAELKEGQKDSDSLPPYETLDTILEAYVEKELSFTRILDEGFDAETIKKVLQMIDMNEYKRRQAPPGIKITMRAFGKDRRMPITNRYKDY